MSIKLATYLVITQAGTDTRYNSFPHIRFPWFKAWLEHQKPRNCTYSCKLKNYLINGHQVTQEEKKLKVF